MKRLVLVGVALVAALVAAYVGFQQWAYSQAVASIRPHVRTASLQAAVVLEFEAGRGAPSYIEYFRRTAAVLDELDKASLSIRAAESSRAKVPREVAAEYVLSLQDAIRELARVRQTMFAAQRAQDSAKRATDEAESASEYARDSAVRRAQGVFAEARSAWDAVDRSVKKADEKMAEFERQSERVRDMFGEEAAISPDLMNAVKKQRKK